MRERADDRAAHLALARSALAVREAAIKPRDCLTQREVDWSVHHDGPDTFPEE
jgi:hypothetical protein